MSNKREPGIERLYPKFFNGRRYYLIQLRKQIEDVIQQFIATKKHKQLIDYGCGNKPYESFFKNHVESYLGADLIENPNADIIISGQGKIPIESKTIDIVLSTQVLEHVDNPLFYLSESNRILKKDGLLILSTHGYWMFHPDPKDYWRWTSAGLKKIITEAGFEIVYFKGIIGRSAMGLQLFQDGFIFKVPKFILPLFTSIMQLLISFFDKTTKQSTKDDDACTFVVVAKCRS